MRNALTALAAAGLAVTSSPALAQQIIDDHTVGRTLAQVQCGEKEMSSAVSYLNNMGVPASKLTNVTSYPKVMKGYQGYMAWKSC